MVPGLGGLVAGISTFIGTPWWSLKLPIIIDLFTRPSQDASYIPDCTLQMDFTYENVDGKSITIKPLSGIKL